MAISSTEVMEAGKLRALTAAIDALIPALSDRGRLGFALVVFGRAGNVHYTSNCDRGDVHVALRELLRQWTEDVVDKN